MDEVLTTPVSPTLASPEPGSGKDATAQANGGFNAAQTAKGPQAPRDLSEIGLPQGFLPNLIIKILYVRGALSGDRLSSLIRLPFWAIEDDLETFQKRKLVEVLRSEGMGRRGYIFDLTTEGRNRARTLMQVQPYTGPAPVALEQYAEWVERQSIRTPYVGPDLVEKGLSHLVLDAETIELVGPAINSALSMFLYGAAGNGKSTLAEAIINIFTDEIFIPYAIHADGQVIQLFDPVTHTPVDDDVPTDDEEAQGPIMFPPPSFDRRFIRIKRPLIIVGGELTLDQLELRWDANSGAYQAPPQMKANGGIFVIDDFGRQRLHPRELLNRWMYPLDRGEDFLTFTSGRRAAIPFAPFVVFATNMDPFELVEEAFLRRIRYKIEIKSPNKEEFTEIFRRLCKIHGVEFQQSAVDFIYLQYYIRYGIAPRGCHPRDLLRDLIDYAAFLGRPPSLSEDMLDHSCRSYFMSLQQMNEAHHDA